MNNGIIKYSKVYLILKREINLDDLLEISCKVLKRKAGIRKYLQESYNNRVILQVQKNLASLLRESCKETSDLLNRHFMQKKWTNQKSLARIVRGFAFLAVFGKIPGIFCRNNALSCKKLRRVLQVLSDSLPWVIPLKRNCFAI